MQSYNESLLDIARELTNNNSPRTAGFDIEPQILFQFEMIIKTVLINFQKCPKIRVSCSMCRMCVAQYRRHALKVIVLKDNGTPGMDCFKKRDLGEVSDNLASIGHPLHTHSPPQSTLRLPTATYDSLQLYQPPLYSLLTYFYSFQFLFSLSVSVWKCVCLESN